MQTLRRIEKEEHGKHDELMTLLGVNVGKRVVTNTATTFPAGHLSTDRKKFAHCVTVPVDTLGTTGSPDFSAQWTLRYTIVIASMAVHTRRGIKRGGCWFVAIRIILFLGREPLGSFRPFLLSMISCLCKRVGGTWCECFVEKTTRNSTKKTPFLPPFLKPCQACPCTQEKGVTLPGKT